MREILKVWSEFLQASISYAHIRSQWLLWEREERQQKDEGRTAKHERVNILSKSFLVVI